MKNGNIQANYDPGIVVPFKQQTSPDTNLWDLWKKITGSLYLIHGENSDILPASIIEKMKQLQPDLISRTIKGTGHAPALMDSAQIELIEQWLDS